MRMRRFATCICTGLAALMIAGCSVAGNDPGVAGSSAGESNPSELTIAVAGMVTPEEGLDYYLDLSEYIGDKVGKPVRLIHKADYAQVNDMLREGKVDVAFVCSGPYVAAHEEFGLELLCAPVVNGEPSYNAYIIVPASSEATSFESLRGKTFAYTDPESNTGHTVPTYMLTQAGENAEEFFGRTFYTYSHDNSIKAVAAGQADGASVDSLVYDFAASKDPAYTSKTRIMQMSSPWGIPPVVVRPGLDPQLVARLRKAFLDVDLDPEGTALLAEMNIDEFVEIQDGAYDSIREMNDVIGK